MGKFFSDGTTVRVWINWQTFEEQGMPSYWKGPFTDAVINAYTRLTSQGGVDLHFRFWGYTTATTAEGDDLVILMNDKHEDRLASWFGNVIVMHRNSGVDLTPFNWVPYNARPWELEFDMQGTLMHEFGHSMGLDHIGDDPRLTDPSMMGADWYFGRFGPFKSDIAVLREMYPSYKGNRLRQLRSGDGGDTWSVVENELTNVEGGDARTNLAPGVTVAPASGLYVIGWTMAGNTPTWLRGDGTHFLWRNWVFYGGERSIHGPCFARDDQRTILCVEVDEYRGTWPDQSNFSRLIVSRSRDDAGGWEEVGIPAGAQAGGASGLCWTRVNGRSTWVLAWAQFDSADERGTGTVRASISADDGDSWSAPVELGGKALSGVSAASDRAGRIIIAFANAPEGIEYWMNSIFWHNCHISNGTIRSRELVYSHQTTRLQPAVTYDPNADRFIMAWRGQNGNCSISVATLATSDLSFSPVNFSQPRNLGITTNVAPALTASLENGECALWYAAE